MQKNGILRRHGGLVPPASHASRKLDKLEVGEK